MEISQIILTQSLKASQFSSLHEELNNLLKRLEVKTIEDILNGEKDKEIINIDNEIRQIATNSIHFGKIIDTEKIAQLIYTERNYLIKGITNADVKLILIFLSVNCYLKLELVDLLTDQEQSEHFSQAVAEYILQLLININIETHPPSDALYHEKEMFTESEQGFANDDIKLTYNLIESIERGGSGFHFYFLLGRLITFLNSLNFPYFLKAISALTKPQSIVFYLQNLKKEQLLQLANESSLTNKWLNFELIRQIIGIDKNKVFEKLDCLGIKNALIKIQTADFKFYKQTIQYFHSSITLNASLGELLISHTNPQIKEILTDCFEINKYNSNCEARNYLWEHFCDQASDEQQEFVLSTIFEKWNSFFEEALNSEDFYQNELLLTEFCDFIVNYYILVQTDDEIINLMKNLLLKIKFIDSEWATSSSRQLTKYHLYLSHLYLLSYAYSNKKLNDKETTNLFNEIKQNEIQIQRYTRKEYASPFGIIDKNLNWLVN